MNLKPSLLLFPKWGLALGFITLPLTFLRIYKNLLLSDIFFLIAFIVALLFILPFDINRIKRNIYNNIFFIPIMILSAGFLLSLSNSIIPFESLTAYLQVVVIFLIIYPSLSLILEDDVFPKRLLIALTISTSLISIPLFIFSILNIDITLGLFVLQKGWGGSRFSFGGLEPNIAGRIVLQIIPLNAIFLFTNKNPIIRILNILMIGINSYVVITTGSRSSLLAMIFGIVLFPFFLKKINPQLKMSRILISIAIIGIIAGFYLFNSVDITASIERYSTIFSARSSYSSLQRISLLDQAIAFILQHPFIGTGFENFHFYTDEHITVHNPIIAMWTENGILGMIGFTLIYIILVTYVVRAWRSNFRHDYLLMGMTIMVIIMVIGDMFMANSYKRILWVPSLLFVVYYDVLNKLKSSVKVSDKLADTYDK